MSEHTANAIWTGPCGRLAVHVADDYVTALDWLPSGDDRSPDHPLAAEAVRQLAAWFEDPGRGFDLPLAPPATAFQRRVRAALQAIPPGATCSYGELAAVLGTAPRAIGGACRANPIPIIVPCHRVVARDGIGGFSGQWGRGEPIERKQRLLALERGASADR